jgi:hypothetical protein
MQRVGFAVSGVKVGLMEQGVRVVGGIANIVCYVVWLQRITIIAGDWVNRNGMERFGVVVDTGKVGVMEQGVTVAGGTANIVCFVVWLEQIVTIAGDCVNQNGM